MEKGKEGEESAQLLQVKTEMEETTYWLFFFSLYIFFFMKHENLKQRAGKTQLGWESEKLEQ